MLFLLAVSCGSNDATEKSSDNRSSTAPGIYAKADYGVHKFEIRQTNGGVIAVNHGGPKFPGPINLELHLTIGRDEGPEENILFNPSTIHVDASESHIYVFDHNRLSIMVYDFTGRFIRQIGRKGQGPGEFLSLYRIQVFSDA